MERDDKVTYDYNVYFRQNCVVPIFFALFSLVLFIGSLAMIIKDRGANPILKTFFKKIEASQLTKAISSIIFLLIPLFLIIVNLFPLFRGGIYLLYEKEKDQIQISGTIENTIEIDSYTGAFYDAENNHGYGEIIIVNGEKYYLTTYGDFGVGDDVILNVLPRSGFVLKMEREEDNTEDGSVHHD